ncbi:hypothetical protein JJR79_000836 [Salmonella enterica]|nr:hypothetical protein [Salmonella enterica]
MITDAENNAAKITALINAVAILFSQLPEEKKNMHYSCFMVCLIMITKKITNKAWSQQLKMLPAQNKP